MPDFERPATSALCHSFRHSFIDALRLAGVPGEINFALVGHTDPSVNGKYGAELLPNLGDGRDQAAAA
jgi:hypothetical protein